MTPLPKILMTTDPGRTVGGSTCRTTARTGCRRQGQIPFADHAEGFKDFEAPTTILRYYRVIPIYGNYRGQAGQDSSMAEAAPTDPSAVLVFTLDAEGISSTVIRLTWPEVSSAVNYNIHYAAVESKFWPTGRSRIRIAKCGPACKLHIPRPPMITNRLSPGDEYWYRVVPQDDTDSVTGTGAAEARAQTKIDEEPGSPWNLAAEDAKNSNFRYTSRRGVLLLWDVPDEEGKASPTGYRIERQVNGGSWEALEDDTGSTNTHFTDEENLMDSEWRVYRVAAVSGEIAGMWSNEAAIGHTMAAAASTLTAATGGATQIDLSWTIAPASTVPGAAVNRIDYFIIERAYGDVMFLDDQEADEDPRAFNDAKSWWNGLDCAEMVEAVGDDRAANTSNPFCKMYDNLADADEATVDEYFAKRYAIIENDFAHPSMMSHTDMNLMEDTEYSYRLRAVYQLGVSDWSETAMATAVQVSPSAELMAPTMVDAAVSGNSVTITWVDGENAARHAVILFTSDYEVDGRVVGSPTTNSVTFETLDAGDYIAVVVSLDSAGDDFQDMAINFDTATVPGS